MFKLSRKRLIIRTCVVSVFLVAFLSTMAFFIIKNKAESQTSAASNKGPSEYGNQVVFTKDSKHPNIAYGAQNVTTGYFTVTNKTQGDREIGHAYCIEPGVKYGPADYGSKPPAGWANQYPDENWNDEHWHITNIDSLPVAHSTDKVNKMILIMYLNKTTTKNSKVIELKNDIFGRFIRNYNAADRDGDTERSEYAYTHAILGWIYKQGDYGYGLSTEQKNQMDNVEAILQNKTQDPDNEAWKRAQKYSLFVVRGARTDNYQDAAWIEPYDKTEDLTFNKKDQDTNTPQAGTSFNGIRVGVYNVSGRAVYDPDPDVDALFKDRALVRSGTLENGATSITFKDLPAGEPDAPAKTVKYLIREIPSSISEIPKTIDELGDPTGQFANDYYIIGSQPGEIKLVSGTPQTITVSNRLRFGSVTIIKVDEDTGTCNEKLSHAKFNLVKITNNNEEVIATKQVDSTCSAKFEQILVGSYEIREVGAPEGYVALSSGIPFTIPQNGKFDLTPADFPQLKIPNERLGSVTIKKVDKDTGACNEKLSHIQFKLVKINNNNEEVIATQGLDNTCSTTFANIRKGRYDIREVDGTVPEGYVPLSSGVGFTIPEDGKYDLTPADYPKFTMVNETKRGDVTFIKKDDNGNVMANTIFKLERRENNRTVERHILVSDQNGVVNTQASFNPHTNNTNGYDAPFSNHETITYNGSGIWFAIDPSNYNTVTNPRDDGGALPLGHYYIEELACDANFFCTDLINESVEFDITENGQLVQLTKGTDQTGVWQNDCVNFTIETTATDKTDGDHYIEAGQDTVIKDHVEYCAKKNFTFTITGILMDQSTGQPLLIDGNPVEQTREITPTEDCGTIDIDFPINTSDLAGHSIVVFEKLYYKDEVKASHEEINDPNQTIDIISLGTMATDNTDNDHYVETGEQTEIKDTVSYCLKAGRTYTLTGTLMDKATGDPLLIDGAAVTKSQEFTPTTDCGTIDMIFTIDSSALAGTTTVVFEKVSENGREIIVHEDIEDDDQTITVIDLGTTAVDNADEDKFVEADEETEIKDIVKYCLREGHTYTLTGTLMDKATGEPLLVDGQPITETLEFTPEEACGEIEMIFKVNSSALAGTTTVVFEKVSENGREIIVHEDIEDDDQTIDIISLGTTVEKNADGTKIFPVNADVTIKDTIKYCLKPGLEYTLKGTIMDRTTGNGILVDNKPVEQTITFTPEETCGEVEMTFTFNTTNLGGAKLIVFETLYLDNEIILEHKDLDDEPESFDIELPVPETGFTTKSSSDSGSSSSSVVMIALVAIAPFGIYAFSRHLARKRFLNR